MTHPEQSKSRTLPSFSVLLLTGFILMVTPLLISLFNMSELVKQMAFHGQKAVTDTAQMTLTSRQLAQAGVSFKRAAGQYFVLEDPSLEQRLDRAHAQFQQLLDESGHLPWNPQQQELLSAINTQQKALFERLHQAPDTSATQFAAYRGAFEELEQALDRLMDQTGVHIQEQVKTMHAKAQRVQQAALWQLAMVILLSFALAGILSWLLNRPVRQLSLAIRRLGQDQLESPIRIHGPGDLVYLGQQLNWLRERLKTLEAQKLRFFQEVSHELKTPLTSLLEAVGLLKEQIAGPLNTQQQEIIGIMAGSTHTLQQRIEDLLHFQEALRQPPLKPSRFSIQALVAQVREIFDLTLKANRLEFIQAVDPVSLAADRNRLAIALENLFSNAIKYSPPGAQIHVQAHTQESTLLIEVCNQGPGIDQADIPYLFQPFYKGPQPAKSRVKSTGLGLAIAQAHIECLGGTLELLSAQEGNVCFQLSLPLKEEN